MSVETEALASVAVELPDALVNIPLALIDPSPFQPRKKFDEVALGELADSIREQGVLQPVVVRSKDDRYELVMGERRWRAAQRCELPTIPAVVRSYTDREAAEKTIVENLQREDLSLTEQAGGIKSLLDKGFSLAEVCRHVGKSLTYIQARMNVLAMPPTVQELLDSGKIGLSHVEVLLTLSDAATQIEAAQMAHKQNLTAAKLKARTQHKRRLRKAKDGREIDNRTLSRGILALHANLQAFRPDSELPLEKRLTLAKQIGVLIRALRECQQALEVEAGRVSAQRQED